MLYIFLWWVLNWRTAIDFLLPNSISLHWHPRNLPLALTFPPKNFDKEYVFFVHQYLCLWLHPIGIARPSPPDHLYCGGIIRSQLDNSPESSSTPYSVPDCWSLILANVTPLLGGLWRGLASKHYWGPAGWQSAICPVFCPGLPSLKWRGRQIGDGFLSFVA